MRIKKSLGIRSVQPAGREHSQDRSRRTKSFRRDMLKKIKLRDYLIGLSIFQGDAWFRGELIHTDNEKYGNEQIKHIHSWENIRFYKKKM